MDAAQIRNDLMTAGFTLDVERERLMVSPASRLTKVQRELIRENRTSLVELLTQAANDTSPARSRWLITLLDGTRWSISRTPPSTLAELQAEYPGARIEPEALCTAAPAPVSRYLDTDRRQCSDCSELARDGACQAARRGALRQTSRSYAPDPETLHRCPAYLPGPADPDRRPGRERWPNLARRFLVTDANRGKAA
ncbi:hypothetical protein [Thiocystis violacea]|uniref:hypothetical protein n=1 Tax=Thiocystis violacea TaxID=13725 RepID=UPI001903FF59|nr:hypothetical protein [Thiocystis violacea]MBK1721948.1 hypothetical protein [Thiocystis violacea]